MPEAMAGRTSVSKLSLLSPASLPPSLPLFHQHLLNAYSEPVSLGVKALRSTTLIIGSDISAVAKGVAAWWA